MDPSVAGEHHGDDLGRGSISGPGSDGGDDVIAVEGFEPRPCVLDGGDLPLVSDLGVLKLSRGQVFPSRPVSLMGRFLVTVEPPRIEPNGAKFVDIPGVEIVDIEAPFDNDVLAEAFRGSAPR